MSLDYSTVQGLCLTAIFLVGLLGGLLPLKMQSTSSATRALSLGNMFAGGIFLGASLLHLLPESVEAFEKYFDDIEFTTTFPFATFCCACGFFFVLLVENTVTWYQRSRVAVQEVEGVQHRAFTEFDYLSLKRSWKQFLHEPSSPLLPPRNKRSRSLPEGTEGACKDPLHEPLLTSDLDLAEVVEHVRCVDPQMQNCSPSLSLRASPTHKETVFRFDSDEAVDHAFHEAHSGRASPVMDMLKQRSMASPISSRANSAFMLASPRREHSPLLPHKQHSGRSSPSLSVQLQGSPSHAHTELKGHDHGHGHGHSDQPHSHIAELMGDGKGSAGLNAYILLIALSFHSILEGIALGSQPTVEGCIGVFLAIISHKSLEAFALGVGLINVGSERRLVIQLVGAFSLMTPLGVGTGLLLSNIADSRGGSIVSCVFQGAASGTFLFVFFMEILPKELASFRDQFWKMFFLFLGFGLMAMTQVLLE